MKRLMVLVAAAALVSGCQSVGANQAFAGGPIQSCGMVYVRDEGNESIWKATQFTTIIVTHVDPNTGAYRSEIAMPLSPGNELRIVMNSQRVRCG